MLVLEILIQLNWLQQSVMNCFLVEGKTKCRVLDLTTLYYVIIALYYAMLYVDVRMLRD